MKVLQIDSSILGDYSASRQLTASIVAAQKEANPAVQVTYYDLAANPLDHLTGTEFMVFRGAEPEDDTAKRAAERNAKVLDDFLAAEVIVVGAPMYNFSLPSQLKAWLDRLAVAGKTFQYTAKGVEGLVKGKQVIVASTRGGVHSKGSPTAFLDHQESYLTDMFNFIGVSDVRFIRAEGLGSPEKREASMKAAKTDIDNLMA